VTDAQRFFLDLIFNPWNAVLGFCIWSTLQTLRKTIPGFFETGVGHNMLRPICVTACAIFYFVPGPWVDDELIVGMRIVMGVIVGTVTTILHGLVKDGINFFKKVFDGKIDAKRITSTFKELMPIFKKTVTVATIAGTGFSGIYGAWLKPEEDARVAYEVTAEGIETLSEDLDEEITTLSEAHNTLDRQVAIDFALLRARIEQLEGETEPVLVSISSSDVAYVSQLEPVTGADKDGDTNSRITKNGRRLQMPDLKEFLK